MTTLIQPARTLLRTWRNMSIAALLIGALLWLAAALPYDGKRFLREIAKPRRIYRQKLYYLLICQTTC